MRLPSARRLPSLLLTLLFFLFLVNGEIRAGAPGARAESGELYATTDNGVDFEDDGPRG